MVTVPLASLRKGDRAIVRNISSLDVQITLMNMGLMPGDTLELTDLAMAGCPLAVRVNGTKIAFRRSVAKAIEVEKL